MQPTRIALVQMNALFGHTKANLLKIEHFVQEARRQQVDIICFPELSLMGYSRDKSQQFAELIPGPSSNYISHLSTKHHITILVGIAEQSPEENKPYITQLVTLPNGTTHKYRKTHLGNSEKPYFSPGDNIPTYCLPNVHFGIQICWDLHFPEVSTIMSLAGAELIFAPHASPCIAGDRKELWLKYLTARAYDNSVFIAACNLIGNNGTDHHFSGGALVIDPKGNVIAEDFHNQESMLIVDLNPELINNIRYEKTPTMKSIFYLNARKPELYKKLLKSE